MTLNNDNPIQATDQDLSDFDFDELFPETDDIYNVDDAPLDSSDDIDTEILDALGLGFSAMVVLVKGDEEISPTIQAKSDRFFDIVAAVRAQFPGWAISEALF